MPRKLSSRRRRARLLVLTNHDVTTGALSGHGLVLNFVSDHRARSSLLLGPAATQANFEAEIERLRSRSPLLVFMGHGAPGALLTGEELGSNSDSCGPGLGEMATLSSFPAYSRFSVLAYACSTSSILGRALVRRCRGSEYLGFSAPVPVPLHSDTALAACIGPFLQVASSAVDSGRLSALGRDVLDAGYVESASEWKRNGIRDPFGILVLGYIERHRRSIEFHQEIA